MKLTTTNGVDIPIEESSQFNFEQNSPFLSEEGSASLNVVIPDTKEFRELTGIDRIASRIKANTEFDCILTNHSFQKRGKLIVQDSQGNSVFAVDESEFYTKIKDVKLRDIFADDVRTDYNTVQAWMTYLHSVLNGTVEDDFQMVPVMVDRREEDGVVSYEMNNEPGQIASGNRSIVYEKRTVNDGKNIIAVPEGYGVAPFLYLHIVVNTMLENLGYTVVDNCLEDAPYNSILLLHNCSDAICKGYIAYADLLPSCSASDFVQWLHDKFFIEIKIDGNRASVIKFEDVLNSTPSEDFTEKIFDDYVLQYDEPNRLILQSETSLEGGQPADDSLKTFLEKYGGYYAEVDESDWNNPAIYLTLCADQIVLRKAEGRFYEFKRDTWSGIIKRTLLGTNYFPYDRSNEKKSTQISAADIIPPIVVNGKVVGPYLGNRRHATTHYGDNVESTDQAILIAYDLGFMDNTTFYRFGSTQTVREDGSTTVSTLFPLTPEGMYQQCFKSWNEILRNNKRSITSGIKLNEAEIQSFDMFALKYYQGQKLLPEHLEYVSKRKGVFPEQFNGIIVKHYDGWKQDVVPSPSSEPIGSWLLSNQERVNEFLDGERRHWENLGYHVRFDEINWEIADGPEYFPIAAYLGQSVVVTWKVSIHLWVYTTNQGEYHDYTENCSCIYTVSEGAGNNIIIDVSQYLTTP